MTKLAVVRERAPGERRVAVVPETVVRLTAAGFEVLVESGAGSAASFPDEDYQKAGARVLPGYPLSEHADVVACVTPPDVPLRTGHVLVGLLDPLRRLDLVQGWATHGVTATSWSWSSPVPWSGPPAAS